MNITIHSLSSSTVSLAVDGKEFYVTLPGKINKEVCANLNKFGIVCRYYERKAPWGETQRVRRTLNHTGKLFGEVMGIARAAHARAA